MWPKKIFYKRKALITVFIQMIFIFVMLELLLRIVFYQQTGFEKFAIIEYSKKLKNNLFPFRSQVNYNNHYLVRPDSSNEINNQIADECVITNSFEYSPSIDYKNTDCKGKYVNVVGYERKTIPSEFVNPSSLLPPLVIRFMGGSTLFGLNTTDAETIPSAFVKLYKKNYPNGRSIKVINSGICGYHSFNELNFFSHLNFTGSKSDIVVFLDGLNDLMMTRAVYRREPYFYYRLKLVNRTNSISAKEIARTGDSIHLHYDVPEELSGTNVADSLLKRYIENVDNIKGLASLSGCKAYFFIQPVPFFNYHNRKNDPICAQEENKIVVEGYKKLKIMADSSKHLFFLGNMLEKERRYPFIDFFHYSPYMNQKIAAAILDKIGSNINNVSDR